MACGGLGFLNNANDSVMNQPNVPRRLAAILAADVVGWVVPKASPGSANSTELWRVTDALLVPTMIQMLVE